MKAWSFNINLRFALSSLIEKGAIIFRFDIRLLGLKGVCRYFAIKQQAKAMLVKVS